MRTGRSVEKLQNQIWVSDHVHWQPVPLSQRCAINVYRNLKSLLHTSQTETRAKCPKIVQRWGVALTQGLRGPPNLQLRRNSIGHRWRSVSQLHTLSIAPARSAQQPSGYKGCRLHLLFPSGGQCEEPCRGTRYQSWCENHETYYTILREMVAHNGSWWLAVDIVASKLICGPCFACSESCEWSSRRERFPLCFQVFQAFFKSYQVKFTTDFMEKIYTVYIYISFRFI